jgi:hypothetical protein
MVDLELRALAALDALEAERDLLRKELRAERRHMAEHISRAEAAEAEVARLREALEAVRILAPGTHAEAIARAALGEDA